MKFNSQNFLYVWPKIESFSELRIKDFDVILPQKGEEEDESSDASAVTDTGFLIDTRNVIGIEDPSSVPARPSGKCRLQA